jgi:hypothetical protein
MDNDQRPRKRDRIKFWSKQKDQRQQKPPSQTTALQTSDENTGDQQRTRTRYLDATKLLEEAVQAYGDTWGSFDFPDLKGEPENFGDSQFREKINTVMDAWKYEINDQTAWAKCRGAVQCAFTAFSPFAKNFLTIAKEGQAVFPTPCHSHW